MNASEAASIARDASATGLNGIRLGDMTNVDWLQCNSIGSPQFGLVFRHTVGTPANLAAHTAEI